MYLKGKEVHGLSSVFFFLSPVSVATQWCPYSAVQASFFKKHLVTAPQHGPSLRTTLLHLQCRPAAPPCRHSGEQLWTFLLVGFEEGGTWWCISVGRSSSMEVYSVESAVDWLELNQLWNNLLMEKNIISIGKIHLVSKTWGESSRQLDLGKLCSKGVSGKPSQLSSSHP